MKGFTVALLIWTLVSPSSSSNSKAWPTHTVCREGNLEVFYQSCDPLQDFGFSADQCSKHLKPKLNIRFGMILREDIKELFLDIALFTKGSSILNFSYPICEEDLPKFSFCGRRKGGKLSVLLLVEVQRGMNNGFQLRREPWFHLSPLDKLNLAYQHVSYKITMNGAPGWLRGGASALGPGRGPRILGSSPPSVSPQGTCFSLCLCLCLCLFLCLS
uniref:Lymphocyte antigen 86 n=1 Tax=Canis lupus familiaris TaxID=9615 RepID=A0A8C0SIP6_CANLF